MTSEGQWGEKHIPAKLMAPLLPLRDLVVFPNQVATLFIGRAKSLYAIEEAASGRKLVLLSAQKRAQLDHPTEEDVFRVGTLCGILQVMRYPNETAKIQYQGLARAKITRFQKTRQFFSVDMEIIREPKVDALKEEALMRSLMSYFDHYVKVNKKISPDLIDDLLKIRRLGVLADAIAASMTSSKIVDKQMLLEEKDPVGRAERRPAHGGEHEGDREVRLDDRPIPRNRRRQRHPERYLGDAHHEIDDPLDDFIRHAPEIP